MLNDECCIPCHTTDPLQTGKFAITELSECGPLVVSKGAELMSHEWNNTVLTCSQNDVSAEYLHAGRFRITCVTLRGV